MSNQTKEILNQAATSLEATVRKAEAMAETCNLFAKLLVIKNGADAKARDAANMAANMATSTAGLALALWAAIETILEMEHAEANEVRSKALLDELKRQASDIFNAISEADENTGCGDLDMDTDELSKANTTVIVVNQHIKTAADAVTNDAKATQRARAAVNHALNDVDMAIETMIAKAQTVEIDRTKSAELVMAKANATTKAIEALFAFINKNTTIDQVDTALGAAVDALAKE